MREISRIVGSATYQEAHMELRGKRVIAIGEREGVQGPSLKVLAESAGAEVVFAVTQCFV
jgi:betaine reductase